MSTANFARVTWSEAEFTAWFTKILVADGAIVVPIIGTMMQSNWPDRLVYHRDWHGLCELKKATGKLSPAQRVNLSKLWDRRPGCAVVLRCGDVTCSCEKHDGELLFKFHDVDSLIDGLRALVKE